MILHIVLLQPKPEATSEEIQTVLNHVKDLQQKIPGIIEVHAGGNLNDMEARNQGYTYGFVIRFLDRTHLETYASHPDHQIVSKELVSLCTRILDFDLPEVIPNV